MPELSEVAMTVLNSRYFKKDADGNPTEDWLGLCDRVARAVAAAEEAYGGDPDARFYEFDAMMHDLEFLPNSPTLMNAGTPGGQLSACFVLGVDDDIPSIFGTVKDMAMIFKSGGGVGLPMGRLRSKGSPVKSTGGVSSGPVSFMHVFNTTAEVVAQGGKRRGALMGTLPVDHPDIMEFIKVKQDLKELTSFNLSVTVTDVFMDAVKRDGEFNLVDPHTKSMLTVQAREIWDAIVECAWRTGEPGLIFIDHVNENHSANVIAGDDNMIEGTNPCVSGDTWVLTSHGPRQVKEIVREPTGIYIHGSNVMTDGFFSSGSQDLFKVKTDIGLEVRATAEHEFMRFLPGMVETEKVQLKDLQVGDILPVHAPADYQWDLEEKSLPEYAYLLGLWFGDGSSGDNPSLYLYEKTEGIEGVFNELMHLEYEVLQPSGGRRIVRCDRLLKTLLESFAISKEKVVTPEIERQGPEFYRAFLRGYFDTDGTVIGTHDKGYSVRWAQASLPRAQAVQRMLLRLGIVSTMRMVHGEQDRDMPDGRGGMKEYHCQACYELIITSRSLVRFHELVGFRNSKKKQRLDDIVASYTKGPYAKTPRARVVEIVPDGNEEVYDVTVPGLHVFDANGIVVGNCSEGILRTYESCNLGSINLAKMVTDDWSGIDVEKLERVTRLAVRFLDDVIDVNCYPLEKIRERTLETRKIGLGVMGYADMLAKLNLVYGTDAAHTCMGKVLDTIQCAAIGESQKLAAERGQYPLQTTISTHTPRRNGSLMAIAPTGSISMIAGVNGGIEPFFSVAVKRQSTLDGSPFVQVNQTFVEVLKKNGYPDSQIREIAQAVADGENVDDHLRSDLKGLFVCAHQVLPDQHVDTLSAAQWVVDQGASKTINLENRARPSDVEKAFLRAYHKGCKSISVYRDGCRDAQPMSVGKARIVEKEPDGSVTGVGSMSREELDRWMEKMRESGKIPAGLDELSEVKSLVANPLVPTYDEEMDLVKTVGQIVERIIQGDDKVLRGELARAVREAGLPIAPPGDAMTRPGNLKPKDRPDILPGSTVKMKTGCGTLFVTVSTDEGGNPIELFAHHGKAGVCSQAQCEAIGRLCSAALRAGVDAKELAMQLRGITCHEQAGFGPNRVSSCADGVGKAILAALDDGQSEEPDPDMKPVPVYYGACPQCGSGTIREAGCIVCKSCGWDKCS